MDPTPVLHLTVGLPGAGKTTLARRIAARAARRWKSAPEPTFAMGDAGHDRADREGP